MTDEEVVDLERRYDDLRTQLMRLKACVGRMQAESALAAQDCLEIDAALYETQLLLDKIAAR